ncbi:MAG: sugar phosphate isomerase/epimerase family protein, partial [Candidatus Hodarchaeota archaeon]
KHDVQDLKKLLDDYDLKVVSWNAIELFTLCSDKKFKTVILDYTEKLMRIGNKIGCDTFLAVPSFTNDSVFPREKIDEKSVERLQVLRKLAKKYEFRIGFEPLGFPDCSVRKVKHALQLLEAAESDGLPPSGLVIDTFHFFLGEHEPEEIKDVPLEKLWLIHFNDSVDKPIDLLQDGDRVWPGGGYFQLEQFVDAVRSMGYDGYFSLELFNVDYWKENPREMAKKGYESLKKYLE